MKLGKSLLGEVSAYSPVRSQLPDTSGPITRTRDSNQDDSDRDDSDRDDSDQDPERSRALRKEFDTKGTSNESITEQEQEDDSDDSDKDPEYAAEHIRALRKEFDAKGTSNELITEKEQEDLDMDDYYNDTATTSPDRRRRRAKGKGKVFTNSKPAVGPTPARAESPSEDDDNDSILAGADALAGGRPSQEIINRAKGSVKDMWMQLDDLACEAGVSKMTMAKLSGVLASTSREVNLYDAYLWHRRKLDPPASGKDAGKAWVKKITAEYHDEFLVLPEDERQDPVARRRLFQDMIEDFRAAHFDRMDDQKERGGAPAVMQKILKYFVNQSSVVAHTRDIHVLGVGLDLTTDTAAAWGGSELFDAMKEKYSQQFTRLVNELKSLMYMTALDERTEGEDGTDPQPLNPYPVAAQYPREKARDAMRRRVSGFLLNLIQLCVMARDGYSVSEVQGLFKTMAWRKWPDKATAHQLVVENWPVALKKNSPGPSWSFTQIKNNTGGDGSDGSDEDDEDDGVERAGTSRKAKKGRKEDENQTAAFRDMYHALERVYKGEQDATAPRIRSWTDEEIDSEDPLSVPVVVCADNTVLVRAGASEVYVKRLQKEAEAAEKREAKSLKTARKTQPAKTHHAKTTQNAGQGSSKAVENNENNASVGEKRRADTQSSGAAPKRPHIEQDDDEDENTTLMGMICRYSTVDGGRYSGEFRAIGFERVPGEMSTVDRYTWYRPARTNSTWRQIPYSRPIVTDREASILPFLQEDVGLLPP
ncbi:hypothetical protein GGX14DRAFT_564897 [Mycena pura]|uniref:Uncharacterized protein n=1 Tax=Mycena pura TaxID=153505 RepID=A0AAD6VHK9_9AGAR|nr:hypothetical protein GGX14DRAFT_564897 [Mycena pura]